MAADTGRIEHKLDALADEVQAVKVLVAGMMPRAEIDGELARRVSVDTYISDQAQVKDRLIKLEASPMKMIAYLGAVTGCLGLVITTTLGVVGLTVGIVEYIIAHH